MPSYLIYAFLSLIPFLGLTLTNKLATNNHDGYVFASVKTLFYIPFCFILVCILGHVTTIFNIFHYPVAATLLFVSSALTGVLWVSYLWAIKKSPFSLFNSTNLTTRIFFVNVANAIVSLSTVTNGLKGLNIVFYFLGIAILLGIIIWTFLTPEAKEKGDLKWVVVLVLFGIANAISVFIVNLTLTPDIIESDVVVFYQSFGAAIASFLASFIAKKTHEFKTFKPKELLVIAISALSETGFYYLFYCSINAPNAIPAISNIVAYIGLFLLVELFEIIVSKKKPSLFHGTLLILFSLALIFTCLAGML